MPFASEKKAYLDPISLGAGAIGYMKGTGMADKGEEAPEWGAGKVIGSLILPPYGTYQLGKSLGHHVRTSDQMKARLREKEASAVTKAKGVKRLGQLLSGSREKALKDVSKGRGKAYHRALRGAWAHTGSKGDVLHQAKELSTSMRHSNRSMDNFWSKLRADREVAREGEKVLGTRAAVGAGIAAGGVAAIKHRNDKKKEASDVTKAKGLGRAVQLMTGSRARALEGQATNRMGTSVRNNLLSNRLAHEGVFGGSLHAIHDSVSAGAKNRAAHLSAGRATRAAAAERAAVSNARRTATAGVAGLGVGTGLGMSAHKDKEASAEELARIKEAFGAGFGTALMSGLKGMKNFAGMAGKSIATAARTGGASAAGQAAMNAGRSGLMRAGQFVAQNPGAGAALVAAPALAAGYAAGRQ